MKFLALKKNALMLGFLLLAGCSLPGVTSQNVQHLSADQIKALADTKQYLLSCSMIGGPPLGGRSTLLILPPNYPVMTKFGPDCQILNN